MGLLGNMFGGGEPAPHSNHHESTNNNRQEELEKEIIHSDFKYTEKGWHGNKEFIEGERDGTLPGFSFQFDFEEDDIIEGMLEEEACLFPTKIKRVGEGVYKGTAYSKIENDGNISNWINRFTKRHSDAA